MVEEVIWIERAIKNFNRIISYLKKEWSDPVAEEFRERTLVIIDTLVDFPGIGAKIKQRKVLRHFLISRHNYLVYRIYRNKLIVVDFIDTRKENI